MASNHAEQAGAPTGAPGQVDRSKWRYLADMELPPDMKKEVERHWREYRCRTAADRLLIEDAIKLQFFFGGQHVATMVTPRGTLIVCVGDYTSDGFGAVLNALPPEVRSQVIIESPSRWNDPDISHY
jgi:hypothetical protein